MTIRTIVLIALSCLSVFLRSSGQELRIRWRDIDAPSKAGLAVLGGSSIQDFWVKDAKGLLSHYLDGSWSHYKLPSPIEYVSTDYAEVGLSHFVCAATDKNWRTHFFEFRNGVWTKDTLIHPQPVMYYGRVSPDILYAYGDWGSLLRKDGSHWVVVQTPIKDHLTAFVSSSSDDIWIGTRGQGVFHYDGTNFRRIPTADNAPMSVGSMHLLGKEKLYVYTTANRLLKYNHGVLESLAKPDSLFLTAFSGPQRYGFARVSLRRPGEKRLDVQVPEEFKIRNYRFFGDSSLVVTSNHGKLFLGTRQETNSFLDLASTFDVTGSPVAAPSGAAFFDYNNDGRPDLFVFSPRDGKTKLYLNSPHSPFIDVTQALGLTRLGPYEFFAVGDLNKDGADDLVFSKIDPAGGYLDLFEYTSQNRFELQTTLSRSPSYTHEELGNLSLTDIDEDGSLDIDLSHYYNPAAAMGNNTLLLNKRWGGSFALDTSLIALTRGWNWQSVHADFDNDGHDDWFIVNKWGDPKLLMWRNEGWADETAKRFAQPLRRFSLGACAADFDNDGDLDLFFVSDSTAVQLYENDGHGYFTDVSARTGLGFLEFQFLSGVPEKSIAIGDLDNDGYLDLILTVSGRELEQNFVLRNDHGVRFVDATESFGIGKPYVKGTILADVDDDGDLDVFAYRDGSNLLWINDLNTPNYLNVIPKGVISNTDGISAKIWVYTAGHLGDSAHLKGYRQVGSERYGRNQFSDRTAHFGLDTTLTYDVQVRFTGGKERILYDLHTGQTVTVTELNDLLRAVYVIPGILYRFFRQQDIQLHILSFMLGIVALVIGVRYGIRKFAWQGQVVLGMVIVNLSLFWMVLALPSESTAFIEYVLPVIVVVTGIVLPNALYSWAQRNVKVGKSREAAREELLQALLSFTHGQWALRNINSLLLLCKNVDDRHRDQRLMEQLTERKKTFLELTLPSIQRVVTLGEAVTLNPPLLQEITHQRERIIQLLDAVADPSSRERLRVTTELASSLDELKRGLTALALEVFESYSCDPVTVAKGVTDSLLPLFQESGVQLKRTRAFDGAVPTLIVAFELADILDNCLRNALRAVKSSRVRTVHMTIARIAPKVQITVTDTGSGIDKADWERIFEQGISLHGGSGYGLYRAREVLQKYGGRISVKESTPGKGTTMTIELNEVRTV